MPLPRRVKREPRQFFSVKSKLASVIPDKSVRQKIASAALLAHETTKQGLFFFKAFCLDCEKLGRPIPEPNHTVMVACLDQVCLRAKCGVQCKASDLLSQMKEYWDRVFCKIYPDKVDMTGKSVLKALVADQMFVTITTDVATRFRSRCLALGANDKRTASQMVDAAFLARWENMSDPVT